jgi:alkylation response protein AidB-like acyl-CoA dehydrogenase
VNFQLEETQAAMAELARQVAGDHGGHERAREVEADGGVDRAAWSALGVTGLLAAVSDGDGGVVGAAEVASALGREVVSLPAYALLTALALLGAGSCLSRVRRERVLAGEELVTLALVEEGISRASAVRARVVDGHISGRKVVVPVAAESTAAIVAAQSADGPGLFVVELDSPGVRVVPVRTTDRLSAAHLELEAAEAVPLGDGTAVERAEQVASVLACASVLGLGRRAVEATASYVRERHQFGRPIASFQSPVLRLADAHIDLEAMQVTLQQAAWQLDTGQDATIAVSVAKWWMANGGHRTLHTAQHLHGGIGADIEYPAHRYFLRGKQLLDTLGGAAAHASRLGAELAAGTRT